MSTRRFLSALACICTSAVSAAFATAPTEIELQLAQSPALYLRLDLDARTLQVMARGMELDRYVVDDVRFAVTRAPRTHPYPRSAVFPVLVRIAGEPQIEWRAVVAPPTLVPFDEDAPVPTPVPKVPDGLPSRLVVPVDNGWQLHLGSPAGASLWRRMGHRLASGWQRLWGRDPIVPPPTLAVLVDAGDVRALVHLVRAGTPLLVVCGDADRQPAGDQAAPSAGSP